MTNEDKALVERLRYDCELALQLGGDACVVLPAADVRTIADSIEALSKENDRLREAGKDLGFYAGHDDSCDCVKGWAKGLCNCGYTETWKQWTAALGETE